MLLELLSRYPARTVHDMKQRVDLERQSRLRGFKDGSRAELKLSPTAFAGANFRSSSQGIKLLRMTRRTVTLFALEAVAPQEGSSLGLCGDFGEKALNEKGFAGHHSPPGMVKRERRTCVYHKSALCALY